MAKAFFFITFVCYPMFLMANNLAGAMTTSASALKVQQERMRVIAENIANVDSIASEKGGLPYQRKRVFVKNERDPKTGAMQVMIDRYETDDSPFDMRYEPHHPAADNAGYVLYPNVTTSVEMMDAKQAQRSYEANIKAIDVSKQMMARTLDLLR